MVGTAHGLVIALGCEKTCPHTVACTYCLALLLVDGTIFSAEKFANYQRLIHCCRYLSVLLLKTPSPATELVPPSCKLSFLTGTNHFVARTNCLSVHICATHRVPTELRRCASSSQIRHPKDSVTGGAQAATACGAARDGPGVSSTRGAGSFLDSHAMARDPTGHQ